MIKFFKRFKKDESGATAIEYGLIAGLIAIAIVAGASSLGNALNKQFGTLSETVGNVKVASPTKPKI